MKQRVTKGIPHYRRRFWMLGGGFVVLFFASFGLGRYPVPPLQVCQVLCYGLVEQLRQLPGLGQIPNLTPTWTAAVETVVLQVRLPRVIAAMLIGAALSTAGSAYQGMFQNPMVSPDILGASAGAGFGAALGILLGLSYTMISLSAFCCGLAAVLLAYGVSRICRMDALLGMVLAGMMIGSLFSSGTSFIKLIADTDSTLPAITYWLMGSLTDIRTEDLVVALPILAGLIPLFLLRWRINLLTCGEEEARSMGIHTSALRGGMIVCATLVTAASVSVSGMIGWVGLVIPHFCRMAFGYDYRRIIPAAMLMGGSFLLLVDDVARLISTSEVPIGILTSFIGAPVFVYLILTGGQHHER